MQVCATIKIIGEVQGVGFRYFAQREAKRMGLKGYVRNLPDGSVESEVEGTKADVDRYVVSLERGPVFSSVDEVQVEWKSFAGKYQDFRIA